MSDDIQSLEQQLQEATQDFDDAGLDMDGGSQVPDDTTPDTQVPAGDSGADDLGGEPDSQQPPAPEPFDPIAEYRARYGTDPPITDPRQLVAGTFDTVEHLQQELEHQRRLAQHWYQELQQRQQAPQPQQEPEPQQEQQSWLPPLPEWNPKWEAMLQRSPDGGIEIRPEYRAIAPPDLPNKYVAYYQAKQERLEKLISGDPAETLWQAMEKKVEAKAEQLMQQRLAEMQRQAAEQAYVEQNRHLLVDAGGNPTPFYHQVTYHYQNLTQNGVQPDLARALAHRQAMLDALLAQQQTNGGTGNPAATTPSATPQTPEESRRKFERQNNRPRRPVAGSPTGGGPRDPEVYPSLKEQLRAQLQDLPERLPETF